MWQFVSGIVVGLYVGIYYDCKPGVEYVSEKLKEHWPKKKE